jgi:hypothetical protein
MNDSLEVKVFYPACNLTLKTVKVVLPMSSDSGVTQGGHGCGKGGPV